MHGRAAVAAAAVLLQRGRGGAGRGLAAADMMAGWMVMAELSAVCLDSAALSPLQMRCHGHWMAHFWRCCHLWLRVGAT